MARLVRRDGERMAPLHELNLQKDRALPWYNPHPAAERHSSPARPARRAMNLEKPTCGPGQVQRRVRRSAATPGLGSSAPAGHPDGAASTLPHGCPSDPSHTTNDSSSCVIDADL